MCEACNRASRALGLESPPLSALNPEPSEVQLSVYRRHVERGTVPKALPAWLRLHLAANYVKPFKPDYRQWAGGSMAHWHEAPHLETDEPMGVWPLRDEA
jgi:hypothetical protein